MVCAYYLAKIFFGPLSKENALEVTFPHEAFPKFDRGKFPEVFFTFCVYTSLFLARFLRTLSE